MVEWRRCMSTSGSRAGIPEVPRQILDAARDGLLVTFIGAGVSRLAGCPSWSEFARGSADLLFKMGVLSFGQRETLSRYKPRQALSMALAEMDKKGLSRDEVLDPFKTPRRRTSAHVAIRALNAACITTNYDLCLEDSPLPEQVLIATQSSSATETIVSDYREEDLYDVSLRRGRVMHIHGAVIEAGSTVISVSDYRNRYRPDGNLRELLKGVFSGPSSVLFVGYGLEEEEILEPLWNALQADGGSVRELKHAMLYPLRPEEKCVEAHLVAYYRSLGVDLVPYQIEERGYEQLEVVLDDWAGRIGPVSRPKLTVAQLELIDKVTRSTP